MNLRTRLVMMLSGIVKDGRISRNRWTTTEIGTRICLNAPFLVLEEESVDVRGETVSAWAVEYPIGLEGPRLMRTWVVNRPPHILGRQPVYAEAGEEPLIGSMRLISFQRFETTTENKSP